MGFSNNPKMTWSELERRLTGKSIPLPPDGGDSPAFSRKREAYQAPALPTATHSVQPYAELHCHTNFSFLDGASSPEELAEEAKSLGIEILAVTDHDGFYGIVRFAEAAQALGIKTVFGAELSFGLTKVQSGVADPEGNHLVILARNPEGYASLSRAISEGHLRGKEKGKPIFDLEHVASLSNGNFAVLTGCRKGLVPTAVINGDIDQAEQSLQQLIDLFGRENVYVELWDHEQPTDSARNDVLARLAEIARVPTIVTNNVHYATADKRRLATAMAAVRARRSLDDLDGWLPSAGSAHLRSGDEQASRFGRYPGAVERAWELGQACAFDLTLIAPRLPDFPIPEGHTEMTYLRQLAIDGAADRYGPRDDPQYAEAYAQLEHELEVIENLDFPGYFLIVWDIVQFCKRVNILCQGRGSAANSAVCYAIGITNVDAVGYKLLFERFLAPDREGAPDIDVDIESDRREEVIQYVYAQYGREKTAQVANVITYRSRSAIRDMAKAFGYSPGQQDAWAKQLDRWGAVPSNATELGIPEPVLDLSLEIENFPRHLGVHSGGMVICKKPVVEVCPVEWARKEARTVLQWDKDDCALTGLVKFDLLGLGMLSAIHYAMDLVKEHHGVEIDLAHLPQEDAVYEMLQRADSIGVFQVESRAQIATLPRLKPRVFYDLVVEVALIRPGPIQGNAVHPYIKRHAGEEEVTFLHPLLEKSLAKTLGVPLFQEQLMQMAIDVAGFDAAEADHLRSAVSSKRSNARMEQLRKRLYEGMDTNGVPPDVADQIFESMKAFANFGFAESHAISFALLVYASAYLKYHYPAAFCAALLQAQPMGFWSPDSLIADARRHGVTTHSPDVNFSNAKASLETCLDHESTGPCVRIGLDSIRSIGESLAERIAAGKPYASAEDLARRCELNTYQLESLATAGALGSLGLHRREALWTAGAVAESRSNRLPGLITGEEPPAQLPGMNEYEQTIADLWATGISPVVSLMEFFRPQFGDDVYSSAQLETAESGSRVRVAGIVTHRQRPSTAQGVTFINLEDETGHINIVCSVGLWKRYFKAANSAAGMVVRGRLERSQGVTNVVADKIELLPMPVATKSRDFH